MNYKIASYSQRFISQGMVEPGDVVSETLKREFTEEALGALDKSEEEIAAVGKKIDDLFDHGVEVREDQPYPWKQTNRTKYSGILSQLSS